MKTGVHRSSANRPPKYHFLRRLNPNIIAIGASQTSKLTRPVAAGVGTRLKLQLPPRVLGISSSAGLGGVGAGVSLTCLATITMAVGSTVGGTSAAVCAGVSVGKGVAVGNGVEVETALTGVGVGSVCAIIGVKVGMGVEVDGAGVLVGGGAGVFVAGG